MIRTPVKGLVKEVHVKKGDKVANKQLLVTLSIMKMHHPIFSNTSGIVEEVYAPVGQVVEKGDVLVSLNKSNK